MQNMGGAGTEVKGLLLEILYHNSSNLAIIDLWLRVYFGKVCHVTQILSS
jgi:hypothetical protein